MTGSPAGGSESPGSGMRILDAVLAMARKPAGLRARDGEPLAALGAPPAQHLATVLGLHSAAEAMHLLPAPFVRLVRPLPLRHDSSEMQLNVRLECRGSARTLRFAARRVKDPSPMPRHNDLHLPNRYGTLSSCPSEA